MIVSIATLEFFLSCIEKIGGLMIAYAALKVHHRVSVEMKIDKHVVAEMKQERTLGVIGFVMVAGTFLIDVGMFLFSS